MDSSQISAARLISLGLVGTAQAGPAEVVARMPCMQAQALGGALVSVALRTGGQDTPAEAVARVRAACDTGQIVRSWTQRGTIHLAPARDIGWIHRLTAERLIKAQAKRRAVFGVAEPMLEAAAAIITAALQAPPGRAAHPGLSREQLLDALGPLTKGEEYGRQRYLLTTLAMRGIITQGPLLPGKDDTAWVLMDDWVPEPVQLNDDEALGEWLCRYALSHGPVTADDAGRWTGLPKTACRKALLAACEIGRLQLEEIDGLVYFMAPTLTDRLAQNEQAAHGVHLLPGFDELILGYKDRSATLAPEHEQAVVPGGNGMFKNTVVIGTRARGTWRPNPRKSGPRVLVEPFTGETIDQAAVEDVATRHPAFV